MLKNLMTGAAALALSVGAMAGTANAGIYKFVVDLSGANEAPSNVLSGTGNGVLLYDDKGTVDDHLLFVDLNSNNIDDAVEDDEFSMVINWSGLGTADDEVSDAHNHLDRRGLNGPIIQDLEIADTVPQANESPINTGGFIPVAVLLDPLATNDPLGVSEEQGTPGILGSGFVVYYLDDMIANLMRYAYGTNDDGRVANTDGSMDTNWYVNLHTSISDNDAELASGHIRDQWRFVGIVVPEPTSMTLLGAGIMGLGFFGRRRKA